MLLRIVTSKEFKLIYRVFFPFLVIIMLLGVASLEERTQIAGSLDVFIRFALIAWYCMIYVRLSDLSTYRMYPNKQWTQADVKGAEKYLLLFFVGFISIAIGVITAFVIHSFIPSLAELAVSISIINTLIVFVPLATQYWVFKL